MKKLSELLSIILLLTLTVSVSAQNGNRVRQDCCDQIVDLSGEQKQNIQNLEKAHRVNMSTLRAERQNAVISDKAKLGEKIKLAKASHRNDVLSLLDKNQKNQYLAFHQDDGEKRSPKGKGKGSSCKSKGQGKSSKGNCGGKGRSGSGKGKNRRS